MMTKEEKRKKDKEYRDSHKEQAAKWRAEHKEEIKAYQKKYRAEHKEEIKKYKQDNAEKLSAQRKQYYQNHYEQELANKRRYDLEHKDEIAKKRKTRYDENRETALEKSKEYFSGEIGRATRLANTYVFHDKNRGFSVDQNIDRDWIIKNIFTSKCIYCGDNDWIHLGADRIDNNKPHTPDNVVCACRLCNMERADSYSVEEFKEYRKLYPRILGNGIEKSWEIGKENGVTVLKKKECIFVME